MSKVNSKETVEIRSLKEIRAISDDGIFEGYITVWDTVDDYKSKFNIGSFKKTIKERGNRIKILYNHTDLIGKSIGIKEDDHGVFVRGKLNLEVQDGRDTLAHLKAGDLDTLSFGFRTIKDRYVNGIREILELALYEYGPVMFEANENAVITDVRAKRIIDMSTDKTDKRSTDFNETFDDAELRIRGRKLITALDDTLWDVWWAEGDNSERIALLDTAIAEFHSAYIEWANAFVVRFYSDAGNEVRSIPNENPLSRAIFSQIGDKLDETAANTTFTIGELRRLSHGKHIAAFNKINELNNDGIKTAHQQIRASAVEALCGELRHGFTPPERRRISALLNPVNEPVKKQNESNASDAVDFMVALRANI